MNAFNSRNPIGGFTADRAGPGNLDRAISRVSA
jgi:hypothetical protein